MNAKKSWPNLPAHLFWEYDLKRFDYDKSARIVIERVIERGALEDWREILRYYGNTHVLDVSRNSRQLDKKNKAFTEIFVYSNLNAS